MGGWQDNVFYKKWGIGDGVKIQHAENNVASFYGISIDKIVALVFMGAVSARKYP